ncbi:MAG: M14 family metallopeptidase [Bacillota bacterium]
MKKPDFARYYDYAELTAILKEMVEEKSDLAKMYSIGKTYEGRDMWMVEITNQKKGCPDKKPAMYIDGNHHAGEVTGSAVCLYTAWYLLSNYGTDCFVTGLVDNKTWYILPRISIDGAEMFLHTPWQMRSSVREWPKRDNDDGLNPEDVDGDGWILQMRVKDPEGDWKVSNKDCRLMVRREPWDKEGPFYRIYQEGTIKNWDGGEVKIAQPKWSLDINRNYPANWEPDVVQRGAGPYPLSEPETRNVANFILAHPNIVGGMSYHTTMGAILRPSCTKPDSKLPPVDVLIYKTIGAKGKELTGYPDISTYEDYTADKEHPLKGVFMDWLYEHQGIITFSTELWDASVRAGNKLFDRRGRNSEESQLALLTWNDREIASQGFVKWHEFDHPQLGKVELGGWKTKFVLTNPPTQFLEGECHKNCVFTLYHAACLPELDVERVTVEKLAEGLYKVKAVVTNNSFMPTYGCQMAVNAGKTKPVTVELKAAEAAVGATEGSTAGAADAALTFVIGKPKQEIAHLPGLSGGARGGMGWYGGSTPGNHKDVDWIVRAKAGTKVTVVAESMKAGVDKVEVTLE